MPKNIDDIMTSAPQPERRSIRNIPIPEKRRRTDFVDSVAFRPNVPDKPFIPKRSTDILPPISKFQTQTQSQPLLVSSDFPNYVPDQEQVYVKKLETEVKEKFQQPEPIIQERRSEDRRGGSDRRNSNRNWILGAISVLLILLFAGFSLSSAATLSYVPKSAELAFNKDTYTAYKTGGAGQLLFSVIKLSGDKGVQAPATGEENVSIKASGKAMVYNNGSTQPQRLIRNTRFETPEGKIYRVLSDISIPGKSATEPGSLEVTLYADQAGSDYNIGLTDFTIPGLKGDPRFTTIYARSKTPMTAGFVGISKKVSASDLSKATTTLEAELKTSLFAEAQAQVPEDFILYPNLAQITYSVKPQSAPTATEVMVNEHAEFYGIMFKRSELSNFLASKKLLDISLLPAAISKIETLDATYSLLPNQDLLKAEELNVTFSGKTTALSSIADTNLKTDLMGISKNNLGDVLKKYPNILTASATVRPFWKTSFPNDVSKISIVNSSLK